MRTKHLTNFYMEKVACPKCGRIHELKKFDFINAVEKPDMKEKILKNELFNFTCPYCSHTAPMTYECIYSDPKKQLVVYLTQAISEKNKDVWMDLEQYMEGQKRWVDNINDLKEKIMIAENHLDDRVVELIKIMYISQMEREMFNDTLLNILFDYSNNGEMCFIVFFEKKGIGKIPLTKDFYSEIEKKYKKQIRTHSAETFMKVDMEWAGHIMFKQK